MPELILLGVFGLVIAGGVWLARAMIRAMNAPEPERVYWEWPPEAPRYCQSSYGSGSRALKPDLIILPNGERIYNYKPGKEPGWLRIATSGNVQPYSGNRFAGWDDAQVRLMGRFAEDMEWCVSQHGGEGLQTIPHVERTQYQDDELSTMCSISNYY